MGIDLIDEAGSRVRLKHASLPEEARGLEKELRSLLKEKESAVRDQDFEKAGQLRAKEVELKTQIQLVTSKAKESLAAEEEIKDGAAEVAISKAVRRARVGLTDPHRPIASFIFAGPTGVGKSELAKTLASYYFGSEDAMIRLDMSEFMERHTVSKLIGSPPGYIGYEEGGQLVEAVRKRPYTVVLFDEIEKAHPAVFDAMLQILDDGRLTDSKGRTVNFQNTLIIMTSNVGSQAIGKGGGTIGFHFDRDENETSYNRMKTIVNEELKEYFRLEFLNRINEIVVFRQLTKPEVKKIADIMLKSVIKRAFEKEIKLNITENFKDRVVDEGFDPIYGARPLRRAIIRLVEDSLAEKILSGDVKEGDSVILDVDEDGKIKVVNSNLQQLTA